jgi:endonuclease/exonuclease/phosphatase family metal-dependent hydrolase
MAMQFLRKTAKTVIICSNVVCAIFLILGCYATQFYDGKYWVLSLFSLTAFYFFVIQVGFLLFWLFVKPGFTLISLITILICWMPMLHVFQWRLEPSFIYQKKSSNLRVMSWNVAHFNIVEHKKHPELKDEMIDLINEFHPDVACFQEMVASDSATNAINYIPNFQKKLGYPYCHFSYNKKLDFDGKHRFGIIIFSKYPIINKKTIVAEPRSYNSIFQYVDIVKNNDTIRVFNIHLQSLKFTPDNKLYINNPSFEDQQDIHESKSILQKFKIGFIKRHQQVENVKKELNASKYPVILCGDFNDVPNSYAYNEIGENLTNAFWEKGAGIGNTFTGIVPTLRIDNIFYSKPFEATQFLCLKKKLSDHYPIITDLKSE